MPITSIELSGFKRFVLTNITRLKIDFTEQLQLILGTNGSGKTVLLNELTPLPADPRDYVKTGYKIIKYEHQGKKFVLTSTMSPSPRHSFVVDTIELNDGGTQAVQKELVLQYFGITPDIWKLITSKERFTQMAPRRRQEWITKLSETSYDYALSVYAKLQMRHRELGSFLKRDRGHLVAATARLASPEEQDKAKLDIEDLHRRLDELQEVRAPVSADARELPSRVKQLEVEIAEMTARGSRLRGAIFGGRQFESLEQLDSELQEKQRQHAAALALLEENTKSYQKHEKALKVLQQTGGEGVSQLQAKHTAARERHAAILAKRILGLEGIDPSVGLSAYHSIWDSFSGTLALIPENEDRQYSTGKSEQNEQARMSQTQVKLDLEQQFRRLVNERDIIESHRHTKETQCPKCSHRWVQGFSEARLEVLRQEIDKVTLNLQDVEKTLKMLGEEALAIEEYRRQYSSLMRTMREWTVLQPFWDFLNESGLIVRSPRQALRHFENLEEDLKLDAQAKVVRDEILEIERIIAQTISLDEQNMDQVAQQMTLFQERVEKHTYAARELHTSIVTLTQQRARLVEFEALGERLKRNLASIEAITLTRIENIKREMINEQIRHLQVSLANKTKFLAEVEHQRRAVADLEFNVKELEAQEYAAKLLVMALSPKDGLIAQGLFGSIESVVAEMNHLIAQIWSYPLEVRPCGADGENGAELDYKFPLMVQYEDNIAADVSDGSTGQLEIIDLAFRVVAMKRLGLVDPPLMLDEFGAGFDEAHRKSAAYVIETLIEQQYFSQVFMVSHYQSGYGALMQAEVCVLCRENIVLPTDKAFNQHAVFEY